jgi:ribose-phosphate pyrophosphokinase
MRDGLKVFSGNAHPELAKEITAYLGIPLGKCEVMEFSNENTFVRILENVRERDVRQAYYRRDALLCLWPQR